MAEGGLRRWRRGSSEPEPARAVELQTALPRPLPDGWTEAEMQSVMRSFEIEDSGPGGLVGYADDALWRFLHSWGLVRAERGRALELGANPYFITFLLSRFTDLDLTLANYFGASGAIDQELRYVDRDGSEQREKMHSDLFNMEADRFPYDDASFDVVLFCEIVEHLLEDPLHALREIRRVLAPGGLLVVTTPNVARLGNVCSMVAGSNIYDPYSVHGPYGRHNREYTMHDLVLLLRFCGFEVEQQFTADAHPEDYTHRFEYERIAPLVEFRSGDLGQYLFVAVRATAEPQAGYPSFLYRGFPADETVTVE